MKIEKFNSINENVSNIKEFFMIKMSGQFDIRNIEFNSFVDAMNYMYDNYNDTHAGRILIKNYGKSYEIYKIKKELIDKNEFDMWYNTKKYNI